MFSVIFSIIMAKMLLFSLHLESRTLPKPLTGKEEKREFEKYANGDIAARDKLIKHNLRLVAHVAKKYSSNRQDTEDLISIGTIGLIKAVQTFDYSKNTKFATYAGRCVENEILMSLRKQKITNTISLEENLEVNNDSSHLSLKDSLQDDFDTEAFCRNKEDVQKIKKLIAEKLTGRERQIIVMRYGIGGGKPMTQQQVCEVLGISRSYVSRLETKAIGILRDEFDNS